MKIEEANEATKKRQDFNGSLISANFADYPPYCSMDEIGNPTGLFPDLLKVVAKYLNLTLTFQEPAPENQGVWYKK